MQETKQQTDNMAFLDAEKSGTTSVHFSNVESPTVPESRAIILYGNMKKKILMAVSFVSILVLLLVFLSLLFNPKDNTDEAGMIYINTHGYLAEPENTLDVLFLGDSEVCNAFQPLEIWKEYGITSYDIAAPAQTASNSLIELRNALKTQSPKVVMLNVGGLTLDITKLDILGDSLGDLLPIIDSHERWKNLTLRDLDFSVEYTYIDPYRGYFYCDEIKGIDQNHQPEKFDSNYEFSDDVVYCVSEIKKLCEGIGAKLVLIGVPSYLNFSMPVYYAGMKLSKDLGIDYIECNIDNSLGIAIDWSCETYDYGDHLNYWGAQRFSDAIGSYLFNLGVFTDKRDNSSYTKWNEDLFAFEKAYASGEVPQTWIEYLTSYN